MDKAIVATRTEYGDTFASSVWRDNVFAHAISPGEKPEGGPATAEELRGTGEELGLRLENRPKATLKENNHRHCYRLNRTETIVRRLVRVRGL